ncbi:MAG: hypothetical protein AAF570_17465, partial [Bacteroidota bacterium]
LLARQPTIKTISVDYTSDIEIDFENANNAKFYLRNDVEQFYHVGPCGFAGIQPVSATAIEEFPEEVEVSDQTLVTDFLVPQFRIPNADADLLEGTLMIGLTNLTPPQDLTLLFKIAEGTGNVDYAVPDVTWSYLSNNQWKPFHFTHIISDSTLGLVRSGLIHFSMPKDATSENTIMPAGKHWIRAEVTGNSPALPDMLEVIAQAGLAQFVDVENDPERLRNPLAAETIAKAVEKDFSVKEILQPYESFGGRVKEESTEFYRNMSEHLRHKGRAINIWDYEHIVLDRFPEVYRCKCLNHTFKTAEVALGNVTVIVVPNLQRVKGVNPLEPRVSVGTIQGIHKELSGIISPFITLEVRNPQYEQIKLDFQVQMRSGFDYQFYAARLHEELIAYLTPWAHDNAIDIGFGGRVYKSVLLDFVEERPYVDYVSEFKMYHIVGGIQSFDQTEIVASSNLSILVSAAEHTIQPMINCP